MVINEPFVNYNKISFKPLPRPAGIKGRVGPYADCVCAFDIETTRIQDLEQSVMYVWQFCIDWPDGSNTVIIGRTWREFKHMTWRLSDRLDDLHLKIYVHNLSHEFQFLAGIYDFHPHEVFAMESRSILTCSMYKRFEFFCSYKLFNMSLDAATKKYAPEYHKKSGAEYEYTKVRYYDTPLTRKELLYSVYDVWGLCKAVRVLMRLHDDNIYSIPRTATGFVRREVRAEMAPYHAELCRGWPDYDLYKRLRLAFRGGNTHANRYMAGEIIDNVKSVDISSSYPSQQCTKLFPITPFKKAENTKRMFEKLRERSRALLIHCVLYNVRLRNKYESVPYLPIAKCIKLSNYTNDNGRILRAGVVEIVVTDIDFEIIERQYSFRLELVEIYKSDYGYLPAPLIEINKRYFKAKTELKGLPGQELYYMKAKNLLNAIYGMSVQDPINPEIHFQNGEYVEDLTQTAEMLLKRAGKAPYTLYQYGVWTTSHARAALQYGGIDKCGDGLIYVDTDSCKYVGDVDFSDYNADRERAALEHGACAVDKAGQMHYMGVFENDGTYRRFITLGAKKYAYEDENGKLGITVAGVPKKTGAEELEKHGGLEAFKPGFVFQETGKLESVYNDGRLGRVLVDGRVLDITRNVVLRETTYKLDVTEDYAELLDMSAKCLKEMQRFWRNCQL